MTSPETTGREVRPTRVARSTTSTTEAVSREHPPAPRWRVAHVVVGAGFAGAAVGNAVAVLPRAGELLAWFADTAWLPPYPWVLDQVVGVAPLAVGTVVAFEAAVAVMLLGRRHESLALGLATA